MEAFLPCATFILCFRLPVVSCSFPPAWAALGSPSEAKPPLTRVVSLFRVCSKTGYPASSYSDRRKACLWSSVFCVSASAFFFRRLLARRVMCVGASYEV
eukprot:scaffold147663_cov35-Tisochrysis_lutea.AAC.2